MHADPLLPGPPGADGRRWTVCRTSAGFTLLLLLALLLPALFWSHSAVTSLWAPAALTPAVALRPPARLPPPPPARDCARPGDVRCRCRSIFETAARQLRLRGAASEAVGPEPADAAKERPPRLERDTDEEVELEEEEEYEGEEEGEGSEESDDGPVMSDAEIDRYLAGFSHGGQLVDTVGNVGFVALLGRPNTGKSTLLNVLLGHRLAAVSRKPQTTRKRWLGILSDETSQILFLDTPGVHTSEHALGKLMYENVEQAVKDADVVVVLVDPTRSMEQEDELVASFAARAFKPLLLALNKCDIAKKAQVDQAEAFYRERLGDQVKGVHRIAAVKPTTLPELLQAMRRLLPEGPFLYPPDQLTDARERDVAAELIRQVLLEELRQEVPHSVAVVVEEFKERDDAVFVRAALHVEKASQKPIVIGKGGQQIEAVRVAAEKSLTEQYGKRTKVSFNVQVTKDWRKDSRFVASLLGDV